MYWVTSCKLKITRAATGWLVRRFIDPEAVFLFGKSRSTHCSSRASLYHSSTGTVRFATGPLHLIVDSTGLPVMGEGGWAAAKHGGRGTRGRKKLHLGVDRSGVIVAHLLTEATIDDAAVGLDLRSEGA